MSKLVRLDADQRVGVDPDKNVWLSASAGSGKTQVLTTRIMRLLLDGVAPEAILAITFTRAGASEMARRIRETLASWVRLPDAELRERLLAGGVEGVWNPDLLDRARSLFARVIDAPGAGLQIQTIHAFCQTLLASFPEEVGLAPGFAPLDEVEAAALKQRVLTDLLRRSQQNGDHAWLAKLDALALALGEGGAGAYLGRCAANARALGDLPPALKPWLRAHFGLAPDEDADAIAARLLSDEALDRPCLMRVLDAFGTAPSFVARRDKLAAFLAADIDRRAALVDDLYDVFFTEKGTPRDAVKAGFKACKGDAEAATARVAEARAAIAAHRACERAADALEVGRRYAQAYAEAKRDANRVEFDDLIDRTLDLLNSGAGDWIRYKLDARIDHILVDEAQDTNARQWRIVDKLTEEFFAGESAVDPKLRTLFVVGDYKQAIYGFQGTHPRHFERARQSFAAAGKAAKRKFAGVGISMNFRSAPAVLAVVDRVIEGVGHEALGLPTAPDPHRASADEAPGRVALWPPVVLADPVAPDDFDAESDAASGDDPLAEYSWIDSATRLVAARIARTVRDWIDHGIDGSAVRAGEVMILVRRRRELAALLVAQLQAMGVPVAGVDRLTLAAPLAVKDLLAAMRFALQPGDDLNFANLLVSPLIGWSHDRLAERAWRKDAAGRARTSLWRHLRDQTDLTNELAPLHQLLGLAGYTGPHAFLEAVLSGPIEGRAKLLARLSPAALDPIEALLSQAIEHEARHGTSLHRFLAAIDAGSVELKRELDSGADAVRVMTVHGAKGLESRIVILADATDRSQAGKRQDTSLPVGDGDDRVPILNVKTDERPPLLTAIADARAEDERQENLRLLYVAMTRARELLFVGGAAPMKRGKDEVDEAAIEESWYGAVRGALESLGAVTVDTGGEFAIELRHGTALAPSTVTAVTAPPPVALPDWATSAPAVEARPLRPLAPSRLTDAEAAKVAAPPAPADPDARLARTRGVLMHALFERLPAGDAAAHAATMRAWLARTAPQFDDAAREAMLRDVLALASDPRFANWFGAGSLAEVPFSALVEGRVIAGSIDRLRVTADRVDLIDFKTGAVPASPSAIPRAYLAQMAAYAQALAAIYPGREVRAALLYTRGPTLFELDPATLAAAMPALAPSGPEEA